MKSPASGTLLFTFLLVVVLAGCDTAVDTFKANDRYFTVYGYLNATADTQWVRVEPLRDSLLLGARPEQDLTVRLQHIERGTWTDLEDSLFRYAGGITGHNYWTAVPAVLGNHYRIEVTDPAGGLAFAEMTMPEQAPEPEISNYPRFTNCQFLREQPPIRVYVDTSDRLVNLHGIYTKYDGSRQTVSYLREVEETDTGYIAAIRWDHFDGVCANNTRRMDLVVITGGDDWPEESFDPETSALPDVGTNVTGGTGFFGGVASVSVTMFDK